MAGEDWRLGFTRTRYAKLLGILERRMGREELSKALAELGGCCSATEDEGLQKYRGNLQGFADLMAREYPYEQVTWDRETGTLTITSPERTECFCPLVSVSGGTPEVACTCSLGWQRHTWKTILQKDVEVELVESVLRGGKKCAFRIKVDGGL